MSITLSSDLKDLGNQALELAIHAFDTENELKHYITMNRDLEIQLGNSQFNLSAANQYIKELEADNEALKGDLEAVNG